MTTLPAVLIASFVTRTDIELGLGTASGELRDGGYLRADPNWVALGEEAFTTGAWGPFAARVDFDRLLVFVGGEVVEEIVGEPVSIPAGARWQQDAIVTARG